MFTVTCDRCGASMQLDEARVPPSGMVKKCPSCGKALTINAPPPSRPGSNDDELSLDVFAPAGAPLGGGGGVGGGGAKGRPAPTPRGGPALEAFDLGDGSGHPDIVDLPAPKSAVPSGSAAKMGRGAAAADDLPDLLAPVGPTSSKAGPGSTRMGLGPPAPTPGDMPDLLAPVGPSPTRGGRGVMDLPVPVGPKPTKGGPGVTDLPAPVGPKPTKGGGMDLLAPVGPTPTKGGGMDLLAPVGPTPTKGGMDLLAPVGPTPTKAGGMDLLTPVGPTPTRGGGMDLLTPVGPTPTRGGGMDLLTPVGPTPTRDGGTDLLTPVGPTPTRGGAPGLDLTPVGPAPTRGIDLPAPKGFFDEDPPPMSGGRMPSLELDAPSPTNASGGGLELDELDLLPPSGDAPIPAAPIVPPGAHTPGPARGFSGPPPPTAPPTNLGPPRTTSAIQTLDLGEPGALDFDKPPSTSSGGLSLDSLDLVPSGDGGKSGPPGSASDQGYDDGPGPSAPAGVISFGRPSASAAAAAADIVVPKPKRGPGAPGGPAIDLASPQKGKKHKGTIADEADPRAAQAKTGEPAKKGLAALSRRARMIIVAAVGVVVLGVGAGVYVKMRMDAAAKLAANIKTGITDARKLMVSDELDHWDKAYKAAQKVLKLDGKNADALGISAQASFAWAIDTGQNLEERRKLGDGVMQQVAERSLDGVEIDKARALAMILDDKAAEAQKILAGAQGKARADSDLGLFLGWAALPAGDAKAAKGGFEAALKGAKDRVPALYGLGRAQLSLGDRDGAKKSFDKVLAKRTNHVGAWVGLASMLPQDRQGTREKRFMEIVSSKDTETAHPGDVSRAWTYAADEALAARRWDDASFRYQKAEVLDRDNLDAIAGRGLALLAVGNALEARKLLDDAYRRNPGHVRALVGLTRMSLKDGKVDVARGFAEKALAARPEDAEVQFWYARVMEISPGPTGLDNAITAYKKAAALDPGNFEPVVALSLLYLRMGRNDEALASLGQVAKDAETDPFLANTLGTAYLLAERFPEAESWFRKAIAVDAQNVDGHANLGLVLEKKKPSDMVGALSEYELAAKLDPAREDVLIRLAGGYERARRQADAEKLYVGLIDDSSGKTPSIAGRAAAGRYFARHGDTKRAGAMGASILAEDARHPAGLFLRGVAALAEGRVPEAQKDLHEAVAIDPQAQYFEALGRTYEKQNAYDDAIAQFTNAIDRDKDKIYAEPLVDRARVHQTRREWGTALRDLEAAATIDDTRADVPLMTGESLAKSNRLKEAVPFLETAVKRDDQNALAHYKLGEAYYNLDRAGDAARHLRTATSLAPSGTEWLPDAVLALAYTLKSRGGMNGDTCTAFRKWKNIAPANAAAHRGVNADLLACR